ncbi:uncharacterized protein LOC129926622 [Biomphalaria glabrata]|uniref:Uncharacterized protein LOC129926622 n=1 Tax=Biomphalaria glabrata TaxID=6526 RepID=A0A9W3AKB1_BIOGL|nr:uncharacterized protein LOC129926622 [Biomphalaria glabrata]
MECLFGVVITEAKAAEVSCFVSGSYAQVTCSDKDKRTKHGLKVKDKLGPIYKSTYIPVLVYMGMTDQFNGQINASRPTLWISPKREEIKVNLWSVRDAMLPIATQFIVSACVIVMALSLQKTLAFRHQSSKFKSDVLPKNKLGYKKTHRPTKLIGKELQALQQVLFIALIFIICNTPKIVVNFTPYLLPDFALGQLNQNLYLTSIGVLYLFQVINSSTSVLIYYNFSSKYRKHFRICFGLL